MESYKLLQRLGRGAQGSVYLVEHRSDKVKYVLKKVECNDESEANKAFKEAMALQELRHQFICGYKEFFVTWDRDECAMFVCIVMDYYEMGDLAKVLKTKRVKRENIDEMILKKWLGQMIEALVFVHKKEVIHRDLKPSNIFMTKNLSICIGDFGVATVMGDARTRTRTTVGSMNWMAPEVMERPYDERSDVWSLGCIILELATCAFLDPVQISSTLFEIKQNPQCLEDVLVELPKYKYSLQLCQLIRTMLRRNFQQRPTAVELLAFPYVKECLSLNPNSDLVKKKVAAAASSSPNKLPTFKTVAELFSYMTEKHQNEEVLKLIFKHLNIKTKDKKFCLSLNTSMKKQILKGMEDHLDCMEIQLHGCKVLLSIIKISEASNEMLYTKEAIKPILAAMRSHPGSGELQASACSMIIALSEDENAADLIGQVGGVQDVLSAMRQFTSDANICSLCCGALWGLAVNESNAKIVTAERGIQDVCNAFESHMSISSLVENACSAIWSLSLEDDNIDVLSDVAISLIIEAMQKHLSQAKVVKNALMALASIASCGEECCYKVLTPSPGVTGLSVVVNAYKKHSQMLDIVENFTSLLVEMVEYDDALAELRSPKLKLRDILTTIQKQFKDSEEIKSNSRTVLSKLGPPAKAQTSAKPQPRATKKPSSKK